MVKNLLKLCFQANRMVCTVSSKQFENWSGRSTGEKVVGSGVYLFLDISLLVISKSSLQLELSMILVL